MKTPFLKRRPKDEIGQIVKNAYSIILHVGGLRVMIGLFIQAGVSLWPVMRL